MAPAVTALVLASALLHALWNAALKRQRDPSSAAVAVLAVASALAALVVPFVPGAAFPNATALALSLGAGLCEAGYFITLALALRDAPLGIAYTVARGGAVVVVWPISALWLGEKVTGLAVAGAAVVCLGLALLGRDGRRVAARGVAWAVGCAACIAGYHLCYKGALTSGAVFALALAVALPIAAARLGRSGLSRVAACLRASWPTLVGAGVVCASSFLVFLFALAQGGAGAVATLRNTSVVFALGLGWLMGEKVGRSQILGTACVAVGAVLLGWPS